MTDIRDDTAPGIHGQARPLDAAVPATAVSSAEVASWLQRMSTGGDLMPLAEVGTAELCDLLTQLELLKNATSAAQARVTVLAEARLLERAIEQGEPEDKASKGIARELALARRESPHAGSRHLGFSRAVVTEMPTLHAALTAGLIGEWTATQVVKETACLSVEQRGVVDAHLAGRLGVDSHRAVVAAAKAKAYELDPYAVTSRGRKAQKDRRVSVRPAPDVMSIVSGYLPVAQGVACFKALDLAAKSAKAAGDERSLDQLRADIFIERLTGRSAADGVDIEVGLVMTDTALLGLDETPARLEGYGPIPAPMARDLLRQALQDDPSSTEPPGKPDIGRDSQPDVMPDTGRDIQPESPRGDVPTACGVGADRTGGDSDGGAGGLARQAVVWLRRLYTDRTTGTLVSQDDRRRRFNDPIRRFLVARDQVCRTPWCDAPVRHADHVLPWARGGRSTVEGGEGLCEACNYAKEAEGWDHEVVDLPDGTHTVKITTPTGHTYYSQPPPALPTLGTRGSTPPRTFSEGPGQDGLAGRRRENAAHHEGAPGQPGRVSAMSRGGHRVITLRLRADQQPGANTSRPDPHTSAVRQHPSRPDTSHSGPSAARRGTHASHTGPRVARPAGRGDSRRRRRPGERGSLRLATNDELSPLERAVARRLLETT